MPLCRLSAVGSVESSFSRRWYLLKFGKGGKAKLHEDDLGLRDPGSTEEASGPCIEVDEDSV